MVFARVRFSRGVVCDYVAKNTDAIQALVQEHRCRGIFNARARSATLLTRKEMSAQHGAKRVADAVRVVASRSCGVYSLPVF